jgi:Flp pilus assembly protein TadG
MDRHCERGSASLEAAIVVPAFGLFVALIVLGGRTALAHQVVQSAAADAARSASLERTTSAAQNAAADAAALILTGQQLDCASTDITVSSTGFGARVGDDASVTVTVLCHLNLSDLTYIPGLPGSRAIEATMTSPIDRWRSR